MGFVLSAAFLIVRLVCYAALAAVLFAIVSMALLLETGACSSISTGGVTCSTEQYTDIAGWSLAILLLTTFTGIPGLMAIAGVFFLLRKLFLWLVGRWRRPPDFSLAELAGADAAMAPDGGVAPPARPRWPVFIAKALGVLVAIALLLGMVGAFVGGGS